MSHNFAAAPARLTAWRRLTNLRWERIDGAVVKWDQSTPYVNPANPRGLLWTAWEPDPSQQYLLRRSKRGKGFPRRWKTAAAAMREVDRIHPLESPKKSPD